LPAPIRKNPKVGMGEDPGNDASNAIEPTAQSEALEF
jgi:hypothetical protein